MMETAMNPSIILGAFGLNIATLIIGVSVLSTKLAKLESAVGVSGRDLGKLETKVDQNHTDLDKLAKKIRDIELTMPNRP